MAAIEKSTLNKLEFYTEHNNKWQKSGVSQEKYCQSVNISYPTFVYWRTKVISKGKKGSVEARQKFLPLRPIPPEAIMQPSISRTEERQITIILSNGIKLSFLLSINSTVIGNYIKIIGEAYDNTELRC